jgi:hypothetical protein
MERSSDEVAEVRGKLRCEENTEDFVLEMEERVEENRFRADSGARTGAKAAICGWGKVTGFESVWGILGFGVCVGAVRRAISCLIGVASLGFTISGATIETGVGASLLEGNINTLPRNDFDD